MVKPSLPGLQASSGPATTFRRRGIGRAIVAAAAGALLPAAVATLDVRTSAQGSTLGAGRPPGLPTEIAQVRFKTGQAVVPYFEGWIRNPDGSFDMVFGYFNRNWKQELSIPAGPDNRVEPMGGDAGQPTYFLPRRHRFIYRVRVPANFGKQAVVWTITANGRTERAYGELIREQEINERVVTTGGGFNPGHTDPNERPTLTIAESFTAQVGTPLTLTARAADDGLPKPRAPRPAPAAADPTTARFTAQVNTSAPPRPRGLRVSWLQYRGPAKAVVEPSDPTVIQGTQGDATATVRFSEPGTYTLLAIATDGAMSTPRAVTVTVTP
jgi:hypothetical protein